MRTEAQQTFKAEIFIAGNMQDIERCCAEYCRSGFCVSIEAVRFVYTGGREDGAVVRLVNYPRFPASPAEIQRRALELAAKLIEYCDQTSALVMDPKRTHWLTIRALAASLPQEEAGAPEGWKLVPVEPTEEMLRAGWNAYLDDMKGGMGRFELTYRAMLAASEGEQNNAAEAPTPCSEASTSPAAPINAGINSVAGLAESQALAPSGSSDRGVAPTASAPSPAPACPAAPKVKP